MRDASDNAGVWALSGRNAIEQIKWQAINVSSNLSLLLLISRMAKKRYTEQCDREIVSLCWSRMNKEMGNVESTFD